MHVRLRLNGSQDKRDLFNFIMARLDGDYPWAPSCYRKRGTRVTLTVVCEKCKGVYWRMPSINDVEMRKLAEQINAIKEIPGHLKLKIRHLQAATKCLEENVQAMAGTA